MSRNPNQIDLFAIGGNGHVYTSWWTNGSDWTGLKGWRDIGFQFPAGNTVTAVSRNPNQIDLFAIAGNGHVYTSWWTNGSDWSGLKGWRDIGFLFPAGNTVTAVSRNPGQIDLFAVGGNGHVYTSWWTNGSDWSGLKGWRDIGGVFPAGAAVSAASRNPNQIDLFVAHGDGVVTQRGGPPEPTGSHGIQSRPNSPELGKTNAELGVLYRTVGAGQSP